ncbi:MULTISPECIES: spore germination protein [Paenibacillus]|uniref:Spore germination protein n=1 Tax=Paenibacillus violae TaxID=3077234 RepID=A0ABU3RHX0_9BACL|nr:MULTISPECIES: spore germination protein [Paenibacillus]MDU0203878.1 spore germination protein [Paenibacillus sp. PFR10]MEC0271334.1 spore germination protein [Paenibacillus anseongense]
MTSSLQPALPLATDLHTNISRLREALGDSPDFITRLLDVQVTQDHLSVALLYIDGLVQSESIHKHLIEPLLNVQATEQTSEQYCGVHEILQQTISVGEIYEAKYDSELLNAILEGSTVILIDGFDEAFFACTNGWEKRAIEEPQSQTVIRGPKESFTEDIRTNLTLLRRKIKSADLRFESMKIGRYTRTEIILAYLDGVSNEKVLNEARRRLKLIDTDSILESAYIEEFIEDKGYTPFPTMLNTERPDTAAAGLLEGQIIIMVDGTPFALMAPVSFFKFLQSSEDYYQRYDIASFVRLIRYASFFVSMLLPSLYIAITTFHQEMLPTTLLISLAAQREGVPFPALVEAFLMEITFEVLREAGVRMPRVVGPAISIVGALVLGQAAVQAGLVSAAMVIVVSFTAISNFVTPAINLAVAARLIRFMLMLLAGLLGLFGILFGCMFILIHMCSIKSFGLPYMAPISPFIPSNVKDIFIRLPWWKLITRPLVLTKNVYRQRPTAKNPKKK